jgi:hypothetical protein
LCSLRMGGPSWSSCSVAGPRRVRGLPRSRHDLVHRPSGIHEFGGRHGAPAHKRSRASFCQLRRLFTPRERRRRRHHPQHVAFRDVTSRGGSDT